MPRRRVHSEGTYAHYVTFSCYKRRTFLKPDIGKQIVVGTLNRYLADYDGVCTGFVIMLDHVHAVLWFAEEHQISLFMDKWKEQSSKQIAAMYAKTYAPYWSKLNPGDPVWQPRYYGFNISTEKKLLEKLDYMHNNPVRAGLVKEICDWRWSSARFWQLGKNVGVRISWPG